MMAWFAVCDADGVLMSTGTVVGILPGHLSAVELDDEQVARMTTGWQWTPATLSFDVPPAPGMLSLTETVVALQSQVDDLIAAFLGGGNG